MSNLEMKNELKDRSAILMVTYNAIPNFKRIEGAFNFVKYAIIVDNNSNSRIKCAIKEFSATHTGCIPIFNDSNYGISQAYNSGVKFAHNKGIEWLFFLDGDADFGEQYFIESFSILKMTKDLGVKLGIICSIVADSEHLKEIRFKDRFSFIGGAITSGIMINTDTFLRVSGYDESLFVEAADLEFTRRIVKSGMKICRINKVLIIQPFGMPTPVEGGVIVKFFDLMSYLSSLLTLRLGRLNVARSKYPLYNPSRRRQYYQNLIGTSDGFGRLILRIYSMIFFLFDDFFFQIAGTRDANHEINTDEGAN